jgi:4-amino-4-deoxy-L-arabinose transferase-like glycosyltransferase
MKSKPFSISKHLPVLLLLFFLGFFAHLGNMPLFDADEGSYSEVSREMLVDQDFTSVLLNDMPFFHKPPLFFWAQAASINILGLNEFALRLPSAIAALLWAASIFLFTRRCYDTRTAWHAALFMGASLLVTIVGRTATPEALLNLFLTLTLLNIYSFYRTGNRRYIYWSFMFTALGVLTKGSIAILLPVGISLIFFGMQKRWKDLLLLFFNPVGLVVFGLIVIPWYLGEFMLHGEAFLSDLLMLPGMETPVLAFLFLPLAQPKSLISVATCLPPLFIIMARVADLFRHSINLFIWPLVFIALLLLAPYLAPYFTGWIGNEFVRNAVSEGMVFFDSSYTMILGAVALLLAVLPFIKPVPASLKYGVMGLLFVSVLHFLVLPIMANILQQPIKSAGLLAKKEHLDVVTWKIVSPSFNVYAERLTEERVPQAGDTVLTKSAYLENALPYETLFEKQGVILVKILENPADDG